MSCKISNLKTDKRENFIFIKLKIFYPKKKIIIKYAILYIYKKNRITKQGWQIISIIKNSFFINNNFSNIF